MSGYLAWSLVMEKLAYLHCCTMIQGGGVQRRSAHIRETEVPVPK
jgi:hypothetical protein